MQKITTFLWFDTQAEEAANFYTSLFEDSKIGLITRYGEGSPGPADSVMSISFTLAGQEFAALNGGPIFKFSEAISLVINCVDQAEVDKYWNALTINGGSEGQCGWLKDKFGVSWQVIPIELSDLISNPDPNKAQNVMQALLQMKKIDLEVLKSA